MARVWAVPYFLVFPVAFTLNRLGQHYDIDPTHPLKWSTVMAPSRLWDFLFVYSNYHAEHHYFQSVPFYNLRKLHLRLRPLYAELGITPHTYREIVWEWFVKNRAPHTDWDKAGEPGGPVAAHHPRRAGQRSTRSPSISTTITVAMGSTIGRATCEQRPALLDLHLDGPAVGELVGLPDRVLHRGKRERHARLPEEGEVEPARLRGEAVLVARQEERVPAPVLRPGAARLAELLAEGRRPRAVDRLAVHLQPRARPSAACPGSAAG